MISKQLLKTRIHRENLTFSLDTLGFVTHELKSPLAAMQTLITVMIEGFAGEVSQEIGAYLLRIRRNCEELQDMVKNYLDLSRIGMGELVVRKSPVDYRQDILEPCVEHAQILFKSRDVAIAVECPDGLTIEGGRALRGATVAAHDDHRIAMAMAIAALGAESDTIVDGAECASVSFPEFYDIIATASR